MFVTCSNIGDVLAEALRNTDPEIKGDICDILDFEIPPETETRSGIAGYGCHVTADNELKLPGAEAALTWTETGIGTGVGVVTFSPVTYVRAYSGTAGSASRIDLSAPVSKAVFNTITMVAQDGECEGEIGMEFWQGMPAYGCHSDGGTQLSFHNTEVFANLQWTETGVGTGVGTVEVIPPIYSQAYSGTSENATPIDISSAISREDFMAIDMVSMDIDCQDLNGADAPNVFALSGLKSFGCHSEDLTELGKEGAFASAVWTETGPETGVGTVSIYPPQFTLAFAIDWDGSADQIDISAPISDSDFFNIAAVSLAKTCGVDDQDVVVLEPEVEQCEGGDVLGSFPQISMPAGGGAYVIMINAPAFNSCMVTDGWLTPRKCPHVGPTVKLDGPSGTPGIKLGIRVPMRGAVYVPESSLPSGGLTSETVTIVLDDECKAPLEVNWVGQHMCVELPNGGYVTNYVADNPFASRTVEVQPGQAAFFHSENSEYVQGNIKVYADSPVEVASDCGSITEIVTFGDFNVTYIRAGILAPILALTSVPAYLPPSLTDLSGLFAFSHALNDPNIALWDVQHVVNMDGMFRGASAFNQDLSGWCVPLIPSEPDEFADYATSWTLPKPRWGESCP